MTNEQILELAKTCEFDYHKKWRHKGGKSDNQIHWECWEEQLLEFARAIIDADDFYRNRCELLQKVQKYMRDPERTIVCDILANNSLLPDPSGVRYGQDLLKLIGDKE
jgi:hypothetical protein